MTSYETYIDMDDNDEEVFINVIKSIPINGIHNPYNFHSYRSVTLFITCKCIVCDLTCFAWNDVTYCIKCHKYCHRSCMRSRRVICENYQGITSSSIKIDNQNPQPSDDCFLKYSLLFDTNFWQSRFNEVLVNARDSNKYIPFEIPYSVVINDQTKVLSRELRNQKSLLIHICHSMHKIFMLATHSIDNHKLILESGRKCMDIVGRYVVSTLPDILQYDNNEALLSIYNVIDTYMLTLNDNQIYQRIWNSSSILVQVSDEHLKQNLISFMEMCREDIKCITNDDRILLDIDYLNNAIIEVYKICMCKSAMDKLAQIIHVLQFLSTQELVEPTQQHVTLSLVASPPVSAAPSPVKLGQTPYINYNEIHASSQFIEKDTANNDADNNEDCEGKTGGKSLEVNHEKQVNDDDESIVEHDTNGVITPDQTQVSEVENEVADLVEELIINTINLSIMSADALAYSDTPLTHEQQLPSSSSPIVAVATEQIPSSSITTISDVFTNALQWLPPSYQTMITTRLHQVHQLYLHSNKHFLSTSNKNKIEGGELGHGVVIPVGTELLILRLRYVILQTIHRSLLSNNKDHSVTHTDNMKADSGTSNSSRGSSSSSSAETQVMPCWNAEVVYLSALAPEGEWLLGSSGYALATLSTALQIKSSI